MREQSRVQVSARECACGSSQPCPAKPAAPVPRGTRSGVVPHGCRESHTQPHPTPRPYVLMDISNEGGEGIVEDERQSQAELERPPQQRPVSASRNQTAAHRVQTVNSGDEAGEFPIQKIFSDHR